MLEIAHCKYCDEEIVWTVTTNGKKTPVNPEPSKDGTFKLDDMEDPPVSKFIPESARGKYPGKLYESHLDNCG